MRHYHFLLLAALAAGITLAGCRSSRHATSSDTGGIAGTTTGGGEGTRNTNVQAISAKMKLTLEAGGSSINCGGTYRLLRDDVVQINLTYSVFILSMNVGTLELTRDSVLLLDKVNKRYFKSAYSDVPLLRDSGVDFNYLQRFFWGEEAGTNPYVDWSCGDWLSLSDGQFPQQAVITLKGKDASKYKATFNLSKVQETADWNSRTEIPSDYEEVTLQVVTKAIMSVTK
ncbi:MAG: DUF4292 domain-containing protein [Prevotellaceae bacterium]|nr:DUF4292 domain-containing protein [Prevotellaceae bacterium]